MDLVNELFKMSDELTTELNSLEQNGENYAKAYKDYRIAVAKELIRLKDEGYAITLAGDIARGKEDIAELKFEEICKEAIYKANLERINALKLQIKIKSNQIDKEWSRE